jgi:photosystem II stability/assembly factor-like uncharacterized protein
VSDDLLSTVFASIAINPADSSEIFAGSGDPNRVPSAATTIGIWRSARTGRRGSWRRIFPENPEDQIIIFRLRVDPAWPHNVYAATSKGVFVAIRHGKRFSWRQLGGLSDPTTDMVIDFSAQPRLAYAGVYGRGILKFDGKQWNESNQGLPFPGQISSVALALAASQPEILYARIVSDGSTRVYRTTDAASTWNDLGPMAPGPADASYKGYNNTIEVDPTNPSAAYGGGASIFRTIDAGKSWYDISGGDSRSDYKLQVHPDQHAIAFDPLNAKIVLIGNDGGIFRSTDTSMPGWHWTNISHGMINTEFLNLTSQEATPSLLAGGSQDNCIEITFGNRTWYQYGSCDGSYVAVDAQNSDTLYALLGDSLSEFTNPVPGTAGSGRSIDWLSPEGISVTPPIVTDAILPGRALAAGQGKRQVLLATADGIHWKAVSPYLEDGASISALAIAPSSRFQTFYVGIQGTPPTIWRTMDAGKHWHQASNGLPSLRPNSLAVATDNGNRVFVAMGGGEGAAVYMTEDGGEHWRPLIAQGTRVPPPITGLAIDPKNSSFLYVSTWAGVYRGQITSKGGVNWTRFDDGLPAGLDVNDIWVNRANGILSIASRGYGIYQRDIRPEADCRPVQLLVRDNVYDRGTVPFEEAIDGIPDAEHPIPDSKRPGFYKPNDTPEGRVYWWTSPDIRIDVPSLDPVGNRLSQVDHVEMQGCPTEVSPCPPGTIMDSSPRQGEQAKVYVQVSNQGFAPAHAVRVMALSSALTAPVPLLPKDFWTKTFPPYSRTCGRLDTSTGWEAIDPTHLCKVITRVKPEMPEVIGFDWKTPTKSPLRAILVVVDSADDPVEPTVREKNERRPGILVPQNPQIALRQLHIISGPHINTREAELVELRVSNPGGFPEVELAFSSSGVGLDSASVALLVPKLAGGSRLKPIPLHLNNRQRQQAVSLGLGDSIGYLVGNRQSFHLPIAADGRARLALLFNTASLPPGTTARFTVLARQNGRVIGGTTYVLRNPARVPSPAKRPR